MKVRGRRECNDCGTRWSYYETGEIACPDCGSVDSVGVDERTLHTDAPAEFDLTPVRKRVDADPLAAVARDAAERAREYRRDRGFVRGGELLELDDRFLAANELAHVADAVATAMTVDDDAEWYLLELLGGADAGERPDPADVPDALVGPRGLAVADAVDAYVGDVRTYLDEHPDPDVRTTLGHVDDRVRQLRALQGEFPPATADRLVAAAREAYRAVEGDAAALARAAERLDGFDANHGGS
jgi:uncharacterized Zn finger protein (UPF0148 family)